jgi:hypothetical protein
MYESRKMRPVESILRMEAVGIMEKDGVGEFN